MANVYKIPVNSEQLKKALATQGNIQFNSGISQVETNALTGAIEFVKYQAGVRLIGTPIPDSQVGLSVGISSLGTPVMGNLDIASGSYTYPATDGTDKTEPYDGITIDTVLFDVNQDKNIIKTQVQGLKGSIKEYISQSDYVIKISGIITGKNGIYPHDEVQALRKILIAPVALKINSRYLTLMGIDRLVVEGYSFPQSIGSYSYQAFELNCLSDLPVPLTINRK